MSRLKTLNYFSLPLRCPIFDFKYSESPVNTEFTRLLKNGPMRTTGLEPARRRHQNLNLARLPIPPCPQISQKKSCFAGFGPRRRQLFNLPQDTPARRVFYRDAQGAFPQNKKSQTLKRICGLNEASGIRTPDNLIKSQVLYQLS